MKRSIFGMLLVMESLFLMGTLLVSLYYNYTCGDNDWHAFLYTSAITFGAGILMLLSSRIGARHKNILTRGDSFIIVALTWVIFSFFGMLPFLFYPGLDIDVASAYFETMSGFTTTGSTVLSNIDSLPHGILLWRSITQWMGGLGIVVFSFALIPSSDMKNSNMFQAEVTGISLDRLKPKIGATARRLLLIYLCFSAACAFMFWMGPMNLFDAINHSMTTIATGGFSTHSASIGYFHSAYVEYVASAFMIIAGINFYIYYYISIFKGKPVRKNEELPWYIGIIITAVAVFCLLFYFADSLPTQPNAALPHKGTLDVFRTALFHVTTIASSTGFQGEYFDYVGWGECFWLPTLLIMIIGSCAGSTAGGVKVIRLIIFCKSLVREFLLHLHPRAILPVRLNGQVVPENRVRRVLVFIIMYALLCLGGVLMLSFMGVDIESGVGGCITSLSNVGPGTGILGPASNFACLPAFGKWLLSFLMLVGRLEIYTVLFLFMPKAWKQ